MRDPQTATFELTGRHVLFAMIAFFGVIFAVNGVFLYQAIGSYTGIVADEPYRKGLEYNQRIAAAQRQDALGWQHKVRLSAEGQLEIVFESASSVTPAGLNVTATVGRPSTAQKDIAVKLVEGRTGVFAADVGKLEEGTWLITAQADRLRSDGSSEIVYRIKERSWLKR